jgi:hypothetical protein
LFRFETFPCQEMAILFRLSLREGSKLARECQVASGVPAGQPNTDEEQPLCRRLPGHSDVELFGFGGATWDKESGLPCGAIRSQGVEVVRSITILTWEGEVRQEVIICQVCNGK